MVNLIGKAMRKEKNVVHILSKGSFGGIEALCCNYARYSIHNNIFVFLWAGGEIADEMAIQNRNVIILNCKKKSFHKVFQKIRSICSEKKADAVIVHHADIYAHYCLIKIKRCFPKIKTFAYVHSDAGGIKERGKNIIEKYIIGAILLRSYKRVDHVIAISEFVKKSSIKYFKVPSQKIHTIYNGIDLSLYSMNDTASLDGLSIIYVGRLEKVKGVQVTLRALAELKNYSFQFNVVGDGPYRAELETMAQSFNMGNSINFLGGRKDVPTLLHHSNIFIHVPIWEEGFGITVVEAMAAGLICICSNSGAIPEIIKDGENGFIVKKNDPKSLTDKIKEVIMLTSEEKKRIGQNANRRAADFSIEKYASALDRLIQE